MFFNLLLWSGAAYDLIFKRRSQNTREFKTLGILCGWVWPFLCLIRFSWTMPVYSFTGKCILSSTDKFAALPWNCVITKLCVTSKIASCWRDMYCLLQTTSVSRQPTMYTRDAKWIAARVVVYSRSRWIGVYQSKLYQVLRTRKLTWFICFQAFGTQELSFTLDIEHWTLNSCFN